MRKKTNRRGFTLAEVLVTITIVAVLSAVMVPAILNQVSKGDDSAVAQDLGNVRTGITTFTADTRHFPGRLTDLGIAAILADSTDINGAVYTSAGVASYKGPYLTILGTFKGTSGALFANGLVVGTLANLNRVCMKDSTPTGGAAAVTISQAKQMDKALDTAPDSLTGSVTWHPAVIATDSIVPGSLRVCLTTK